MISQALHYLYIPFTHKSVLLLTSVIPMITAMHSYTPASDDCTEGIVSVEVKTVSAFSCNELMLVTLVTL